MTVQLLTTQHTSWPHRLPHRRSYSLTAVNRMPLMTSATTTVTTTATAAVMPKIRRRHSLAGPIHSLAWLHHISGKKQQPSAITVLAPIASDPESEVSDMELDDVEMELVMEQQPEKVKGILKKSQDKEMQCREKKTFRFNETVLVGETFAKAEYERRSNYMLHLTPELAFMIKKELNEFKMYDMPVHEESRQFTHLYPL